MANKSLSEERFFCRLPFGSWRVKYLNPMKNVTVAVFNSLTEAEPLKQRLVAAGIQAEMHSESKLDEDLDFARVSAGVRIEVPRADFEAALEIVYDWNSAKEPEKAVLGQIESIPPAAATRRTGGSPSSPA